MFSFQARTASSPLGGGGNGVVTQTSNDGGIDGVIDQDALGLSKIYVQAKHHGEKIRCAAPRVSHLWAQCTGRQHRAYLLPLALLYIRRTQLRSNLGGGLSLVLIDGERLACLMIKYCVGVQVARTYTVMKLDEDFCEGM